MIMYRHDKSSVSRGVAVCVKNIICSTAAEVPENYRDIEVVCVSTTNFYVLNVNLFIP